MQDMPSLPPSVLAASLKSPIAEAESPWWRTRTGWALCGLFLAAGAYILAEHAAHTLAALPYLLFAGCALMHLFMDHGHHDSSAHGPADTGEQKEEGR